jgi:hypothetical protein
MADKKISALTAASTPLAGTEVLPIVQSGATVKVAVSDLTAGRAIAATSVTTAAVQASNSGGLALKNSGGTTQMTLGGGGGDNITLSVATNITPANAAVAISPTGTGTVTINPATASTINNTSIGATTASTGRFTSVTLSTDNIVQGTAAKGFNFTANTPAAGMTSQLLNWYEEGTWTGTLTAATPPLVPVTSTGRYTRIGRQVTVSIDFDNKSTVGAAGAMAVTGLPFTAGFNGYGPTMKNSMGTNVITAGVYAGNTQINFADAADMTNFIIVAAVGIYLRLSVTYTV